MASADAGGDRVALVYLLDTNVISELRRPWLLRPNAELNSYAIFVAAFQHLFRSHSERYLALLEGRDLRQERKIAIAMEDWKAMTKGASGDQTVHARTDRDARPAG
jgi:predicted nucleic acid-binding protein